MHTIHVSFLIFKPSILDGPGCRFETNSGDLGFLQPLLLISGTNELLQPLPDGGFVFNYNDKIDLACTSNFADSIKGKRVTAYCKGGKQFCVQGIYRNISEIQCTLPVQGTARKTTRKCYNNSTIAEIGFSLGRTFITTIEVCFNPSKASSYYSHYSIYPATVNLQRNSGRPQFAEGDFYGFNVFDFYNIENQEVVFRDVVSLGREQPVVLNKTQSLCRGHLAAKADFILGPAQFATFFLINTAPSWICIDGGGWMKIEDDVRKLAYNKSLNLELYTGTYDILKLRNAGNLTDLREIYLNANEKLLPVPRFFYKVVIDKDTRRGIVLIRVNNPFLTANYIRANEVICPDVSNQIKWVKLGKNIYKGYSYACDVHEFVKRVPHLPFLNVTGLLYSWI